MYNFVRTKYGYYKIENPPTQKELESYYQSNYYQEAKGSYELDYDEEEIRYFKNKISESAFIAEQNFSEGSGRKFLDVGCGEGWALKLFKDKDWEVTGLDYSGFGCKKFNPDCLDNLMIGDIYGNLKSLISQGRKYDLVFLDNVLEHVLDPEGLVNVLKKVMMPSGILAVDVPNDYSILQKYLLDKKYVDHAYWHAIPDHLSYFDKAGLENLFQQNGWISVMTLADFPIDWNLVNPNSNYIVDKSKGKACHRARIEMENLFHTQPIEKVINFYKAMAEMGLGRSIIGYFKINS
jgi:SAM-dependent methyltransferase